MSETSSASLATTPALANVVSDVLGDLAFLVSEDQSPQLPPGAIWIEGCVSYRGPISGQLCCWCTQDLARQLAANLLGLEPDSDSIDGRVYDAVAEFANIVCGQLITTCHGTTGIFDLAVPTALPCAQQPELDFAAGTLHCGFTVAGEPLFCAYQRVSG